MLPQIDGWLSYWRVRFDLYRAQYVRGMLDSESFFLDNVRGLS